MEIRELCAADEKAVVALHAAMGLDYKLPVVNSLAVKNGIFNGTGKPVAVVLGRATTEAYLLLDKSWGTPAERWDAVLRVIAVSQAQARIMGFEDVHVWLPPSIEKTFSRRLKKIGFMKAPWVCYSAKL